MRNLIKSIAVGAMGAAFVLGPLGAAAQGNNDGADYHPMQRNSAALPDVDAGAIAAAHPTGTESIGQSTSPAAMKSNLTRAEVRKGAVAAAHPMQTEAIGQSTGMAGVTSTNQAH